MSKKRPRQTRWTGSRPKAEPGYWEKRVFKNTYTYKGRLAEVGHWCVKLQHLGRRKTFTLGAARKSEAVVEACELYRAILRQGWERVGELRKHSPAKNSSTSDRLDVNYWAQRLIHRAYGVRSQTNAAPEFSAQIEYEGASFYFPLGTGEMRAAAKRAQEIYQTVSAHGWEQTNKRFSRELAVAFRWIDNPLAWTYTTIHTQIANTRSSQISVNPARKNRFDVAIVEPDAGIRRALVQCLNSMSGFACVAAFSSGAETLQKISQQPVRLVLVSHQLTGNPGAGWLEELKAAVPDVAGLLYSVYEDSEELFKATPGGAAGYLLKRMPPTQFLEPIAALLGGRTLSNSELANAVWQYFQKVFASLPVGGFARPASNLTQREHEVLGLLSKGHPDKEIAEHLSISIYTVHEHVRNIFEKLGVHNRTEAVVKYLQK